MLELVII